MIAGLSINFELIWNKGIAFGLFSLNDGLAYNLISTLIMIIVLMIKPTGFFGGQVKKKE